MAKSTVAKKRRAVNRGTTATVTAKTSATKKRGQLSKVVKKNSESVRIPETQKNAFEEKFGEGTAFDLDYGKLLIIGLCVYIAFQVS